METLSLFLLKSIVVSGLLTTWYLLGLRGRRLHQYNRIFLLSILFLSLTIPLLHFQLFSIPRSVSGSLAPVALFVQPENVAGSNMPSIQQSGASQTDWQIAAVSTVAGISLVLLAILSVRIFKVRRMCRQCAVTQLEGINLVLTDSPKAPFTFLRYVFWNRALPLQDEIDRLIFRHELAHIEQGHTYDKLVCQALTCIFWFNPFYWIIQKELSLVHEFVADEQAVDNRDTEAFAMMLLRSYSNGSYLAPEHYFFSSAVKRRLAMLQSAAKPSFAVLRRFIAVPLIAGTILLFSFSDRKTVAGEISPAKRKIVLLLDAAHGGKDAGEASGGYTEKEINLKYARRIKELSPDYNVEVQLTRDNDDEMQLADRVAISDKINPNVFISLHVGEEPGKEKEKGDIDIYVSGQNAQAAQSSNYSSAIFQAMAQDGVIPGISQPANHTHSAGCNCSNCISQGVTQNPGNSKILSTEKGSIYVLKHVHVPAMVLVLGNIKSETSMRQLTDNDRLDLMCHAILKGVVHGATPQQDGAGNPLNFLPATPGDSKCAK
jgi:N-acetylmuramoyl-L-alanine amidase